MVSVLRSHALRVLAAGAATAAGAALPRPARSQALVPLRLVLFSGETAATAYYAKDRGLFTRAGLDVTITELTNGAAGASAVASGSMDIGFSNPLSLAQGHERGLGFSIIAPAALAKDGQETNGFIIVSKTSPLRSPKDFNGKTLSVNGVGGITDFTIRNWIDKNGGDSKSVHFLELAFSEMMPALASGRVDVSEISSSFDPLIGKPNDTVRMLGNSYATLAPQFLSSVWFSTTEWIAKNPETAKKFIAVMRESAIWANANHHEAAVLLAPHLKRSVESIEGAPRALFGLDVTPELLQPLIDVAAKYGGLKAPFPAREIISPLAHA
jgi:ABC-type nitrate/sulfonate/bicarbonate transport system substrate-binding protein